MSRSIVQKTDEKECYFCRALDCLETGGLSDLRREDNERHHIFFGYSSKDRDNSEKYGLWVYLCPYHHRIAPESVHKSKATCRLLHRIGQKAFEDLYGHEKFMEIFKENYIMDNEGGDE